MGNGGSSIMEWKRFEWATYGVVSGMPFQGNGSWRRTKLHERWRIWRRRTSSSSPCTAWRCCYCWRRRHCNSLAVSVKEKILGLVFYEANKHSQSLESWEWSLSREVWDLRRKVRERERVYIGRRGGPPQTCDRKNTCWIMVRWNQSTIVVGIICLFLWHAKTLFFIH